MTFHGLNLVQSRASRLNFQRDCSSKATYERHADKSSSLLFLSTFHLEERKRGDTRET